MAIVAVMATRGYDGQPFVPQIGWYLLIDWPLPGRRFDGRARIDGRYALELRFNGQYGWFPNDWISRPWPSKPHP